MDIYKGLKRGNPNKKGAETGAECFADNENVKNECVYDGTQINFGVDGNQMLGAFTGQGMACIGGAGSGKSLIVQGNLIHYQGSIAVIDPKLEHGELVAPWRDEGMGQDVFILSAGVKVKKRLEKYLASWNPLERLEIDSDTLLEDIGIIGDSCIITVINGEPFWTDSAQSFFEGVCAHVISCPLYADKKDLVTVFQLISKGKNITIGKKKYKGMEGLIYEMLHSAEILNVRNEELAEFIEASATQFWDRADKERASVLSTLRTQLKFLRYKSVRKVLRGQKGKKKIVDLADLKKKKMSIFLSIPAGKLLLFNRLMRLFVNLTLEAVEREKQKPQVPVLLVAEEFPIMDRMRTFEVAAGFVRGFSCKLYLIAQNLGQIKAIYPESWETFLGNNLVQFFGNNDLTTLKYIEERLGNTPVRTINRTISTSEAVTDETISQQLQPLITAQEAARFFGRDDPLKRQVVIWPSYDPIICQRTEWFRKDTPYYKKYFSKFCKFLEEQNK
jgi:type IV secretion system protein VirD4